MAAYKWLRFCWVVPALCLTAATASAEAAAVALKETFPRVMGLNISSKHYADPVYATQMSRFDAVILGFYPGWNEINTREPVRDAVRALKKRNPRLLVGQYTVLNESYQMGRWANETDRPAKLDAERWWLIDAGGRKVQWTDEFDTWETNSTEWTRPDSAGRRYPEWLAERDYSMFFGPVPEFDIWYFDNTSASSAVSRADWDLDGKDDSSGEPRISSAIRRGQRAHWRAARRLAPNAILMGNVSVTNDLSSDEHRGQLGGAFLEGMMGLDWSLERSDGWLAMMARYFAVYRNTASPHLVAFHAAGRRGDYRRFRFALASCLMGNGYFVYTDVKGNDKGIWWFDEYDVALGRATSPEQSRPWNNGVFRRDFELGIVLVNPTLSARTVQLEPGLRHFAGTQDSEVNNGQSILALRLAAQDGVVLVRQSGAPAPDNS